ncbi:MAG: hypothetical protein WDW36_003458 [Sanguina aurantia]
MLADQQDEHGTWPLPALGMSKGGRPDIHIFWDLDNIRPRPLSSSSARTGGSAFQGPDQGEGRGLVELLDSVAHVCGHYGHMASAHLYVNQASLASAAGLQEQALQLRTWAAPQRQQPVAAGQPQPTQRPVGANATAGGPRSRAGAVQRRQVSGPGLREPFAAGGREAPSRQQQLQGMQPGSSGEVALPPQQPPQQQQLVHRCPLCSHSGSSYSALLQHFSEAHQRPFMAETAREGSRLRLLQRQPAAARRFFDARYALLTQGLHLDEFFFSRGTAAQVGGPGAAGGGGGAAGGGGAVVAGLGQVVLGSGGGIGLTLADSTDQAVDRCIEADVLSRLEMWAGPEPGDFRASPAGGHRGPGRSAAVPPAPTAPQVVCIVSNDQGYGKLMQACQQRGVETISVCHRRAYDGATMTLSWDAIARRQYIMRRP